MLSVKAQISSEALFAVVIVLFLGLVIAVFASEKSNEASQLFDGFSSKANCEKLSTIIYSLSNSSAKPSVFFDLDSNASISKGVITVGKYYCDFFGIASDTNLTAGKFKASKNSQGVVVFEKVS